MTQSLGLITGDLVDETTASLHDIYGEGRNWQTVVLKDTVMDVVARLSSRVFLGKDLCRDPRWLQILPSTELVDWKRFWPVRPTYRHGGISYGTVKGSR